jgi:hypothetical protein
MGSGSNTVGTSTLFYPAEAIFLGMFPAGIPNIIVGTPFRAGTELTIIYYDFFSRLNPKKYTMKPRPNPAIAASLLLAFGRSPRKIRRALQLETDSEIASKHLGGSDRKRDGPSFGKGPECGDHPGVEDAT